MKHITKTILSLLSLCSPFAAYAETLTVEGDLEVQGSIEAGSTTTFGRFEVVNDSTSTIGAITAPAFDQAFLYIANPTGDELGFDPNQLVANTSGPFHFYNSNSSGSFLFRTGRSNYNALSILSDGNVGIGTDSPVEKLDLDGAIRLGTTTNANAGTIRFDSDDFWGHTSTGWISLTSGGSGSSGPATSLVSADNNNETAIAVTGADAATLSTTITGKVVLATAQGDIPMFGQ